MTKPSNEKITPGPPRTGKKRLRVKIPSVNSFRKLPASLFNHSPVETNKAQNKEEKEKAANADNPKAGADVGKIVNLIAGDANRVRNIIFFFVSFLLMPSF